MALHVPLPSWTDIGMALAGNEEPANVLSRPWLTAGSRAVWFSRGAFALRAIARRQQALRGRDPILWLPDYFCNQSTAPLRADGVRLVFYPMTESLTVDWDDFPSDRPPPDMVLAVHHFGRPADMTDAVAFARKVGAILIEDAAHAIMPGGGIGSAGDVVLFCPRKIYPVPDGAVLIAREAEADALIEYANGSAPNASSWLAKRAIQKAWPAFVAAQWTRKHAPGFDVDPTFEPLPETPALSRLARRMIARASADLDEEAAARRRHWNVLSEIFADRDDARPFWQSWPETAGAPYRFLLRARDRAAAQGLYRLLAAEGVPVETWPDLAPEVTAHPERHGAALALRRTILMLPVHKSLNLAALRQRISRALRWDQKTNESSRLRAAR